jgi:hypothetical protein
LKCDDENGVKELLSPKGLGDYQAMVTLTNLINLLVFEIDLLQSPKRFKKAAYLFIDELDLLATSSAKEAREVNELLRHIYDNCPNCFCLVLAFTATAAELNVLFAEYVLQRVSKQIKMDLLGIDDAKTLCAMSWIITACPERERKGISLSLKTRSRALFLRSYRSHHGKWSIVCNRSSKRFGCSVMIPQLVL